MTNLTPAQEEALNRAIAINEGWQYNKVTDFWSDGKTLYAQPTPNYTRDLNKIVAVVQRWCLEKKKNLTVLWDFTESEWTIIVGIDGLCIHKQHALALCLAFAKAEPRVKWGGE